MSSVTARQGSVSFAPSFGAQFSDVSESIPSISPSLNISGTWHYEVADSFVAANGNIIEELVPFPGLKWFAFDPMDQWRLSQCSGSHACLGMDMRSSSMPGLVGMQF